MPKKKPYQKKSFESTGAPNDTSANLYITMLMSPAWGDLTNNQRVLYTYCKAQLYAEKRKPEPDGYTGNRENLFTMNKTKWCTLYKLYDVNNGKGFYRDMNALIEKGFVECVECGRFTRTKSVYAYSDKWQEFN